jgi:DNA repair exonuclease SbcCD ATPase subunit
MKAKLKTIRAQNYGPIKDIELDMDHVGVTIVRGQNLDAGSGLGHTNAAGKSLLMSVLPEMMWGSPPSGRDRTKIGGPKTETILSQTWVKADGTELTFKKHYGKGKRFEILKNGKTLNNRTLQWAQDRLKSIVGGSEEGFYSTRFIDSTIPHPLIVGSAATRQEYLVRLFKLENVDAIRKVLLVELRDVQKAGAAYREIKNVFDSQKEKAGSLKDYDSNVELLKRLTAKQKKLLSALNRTQWVQSLLQFEERNERLLSKFDKLTTLGSFADDMEQLELKISKLVRQLKSASEWTEYKIERAQWKSRTKKLTAELEELGVAADFDHDKILKRAKRSRAAQIDLGVVDAEIRQTRSRIEDLDLTPVEKSRHDPDEIRKRLDSLRDELEHVSKFHSGKCPTCGSKVEARSKSEIKDEIEVQSKRLKAALRYKKFVEAEEQNQKLRSELSELKAKREELQAKCDPEIEKAAQVVYKFEEPPEKPRGEPIDATSIQEQLDKSRDRLSTFKQFRDVIDTIGELRSIRKEDREEAKSNIDLADKVQALNVRVADLSARTVAQEQAIRTLKDLAAKGTELKEKAKDEKVIKALIDAYSKKGLKRALMERGSKRLEHQLNKMSRLFFAEDLVFEFKYGSSVEILVHRKFGKKVQVSDVKRLSGAEKRMFTLLLVAASVALTPAADRPHEIVLDEPESNLGPDALANFIKVIPVLNRIIPHIVVVTPRPDLEIPGARVVTVVKHRGVSTLKVGSYDQVADLVKAVKSKKSKKERRG